MSEHIVIWALASRGWFNRIAECKRQNLPIHVEMRMEAYEEVYHEWTIWDFLKIWYSNEKHFGVAVKGRVHVKRQMGTRDDIKNIYLLPAKTKAPSKTKQSKSQRPKPLTEIDGNTQQVESIAKRHHTRSITRSNNG